MIRRLVKALANLAFGHEDETRRLRGLWALHSIEGLDLESIKRGLKDQSPYVRGWTVQLATEQGAARAGVLSELVPMAKNDDSPIVRLYLASAAGRLPLEARWDILKGLLSHAEDANDHNLPLMYWYATEPLARGRHEPSSCARKRECDSIGAFLHASADR